MRAACLLLVFVSLATPRLAARSFLDLLLGRRDLEVITVTDVTPAGRLLPPASKAQPQYYIALSAGYRDLGAAIGGIKEPPSKDAIRLISAELAKQGYLPATSGSPAPTLVLVYTWGTLNADNEYGFNPDLPPRQRNRAQIVSFLGGRKLGLDRDFFDPLTAPVTGLMTYGYDAQAIHEIAREDFYIIVVNAYDIATIRTGQRRLLWMTRIACPSLGFDLPGVMGPMLAIAGPHLGRETARPVWVSATDKFKPNVKLGEIQLVEYLGASPLPVVEKPAEPAKPKRAEKK